MSELAEKFQNKLQKKMANIFEEAIEEREEYYANNPDDKITDKSCKSIIKECSYKNAMITGAMNIIPGPLGMLAAVPEIYLVLKNQITMIIDIGVASGKRKEVLNKEVLMYAFASSLGAGALGLATMHGSKIVVKRVSLRFMQKIVKILAGKITQRALKALIGKWIPVVGPIAMAVWTNYLTKSVGNKAVELMSKDITIEDSSTEDQQISVSEDIQVSESVNRR